MRSLRLIYQDARKTPFFRYGDISASGEARHIVALRFPASSGIIVKEKGFP